MSTRTSPPAVLLGSCLLCLAAGGCASLSVADSVAGGVAGRLPAWVPGVNADGVRRASAKNPVTQVAGFWRHAEDTGPDGRPVRGFAGKILLFPASSRGDEPVAARGSVRVSLYDQAGAEDVLIHQYDLPPDAWETHLAQSNLGVGYEVFLPYLGPQTGRTRCGLRIRFVPDYDGTPGRPVFSAMESCVLEPAGPTRRATAYPVDIPEQGHGVRSETIRPVAVTDDRPRRGDRPSPGGVRRASAEEPADGPDDGLSPEMKDRIRKALARRSRDGGEPAAAPSAVTAEPGRRFTLTPDTRTEHQADGAGAAATHPLAVD